MVGVWRREMTRWNSEKGTMHTAIQRKTPQVLMNRPDIVDQDRQTGWTDMTQGKGNSSFPFRIFSSFNILPNDNYKVKFSLKIMIYESMGTCIHTYSPATFLKSRTPFCSFFVSHPPTHPFTLPSYKYLLSTLYMPGTNQVLWSGQEDTYLTSGSGYSRTRIT